MRYLYQKNYESTEYEQFKNDFLCSCQIEVLRPTIYRCKLKRERLTFYECLSRWYFGIITGWKYRIYYLLDGNNIVHTSFVVPKCYKFPFLGEKDYEVGPCVTECDYRRRGCYHYILQYISSQPEYNQSKFYMIVKSTNKPSIKGIEKAGFTKCGYVRRTGFWKIYKKE